MEGKPTYRHFIRAEPVQKITECYAPLKYPLTALGINHNLMKLDKNGQHISPDRRMDAIPMLSFKMYVHTKNIDGHRAQLSRDN